MGILDSALDTTLAGYTKLGVGARGINVDEPFPEVSGKHIMITGATGGIGRSAAERLVANGAVVHAVGRSQEKLDALVAANGELMIPHRADLSSITAISQLATDYIDAGFPLHGLVNNVGIMIHERTVTDEGWEITYATNLLGQYVLTQLLLPVLEESAPSTVVMVSSGGMYSQGLTVSNLQSSQGEYNGTNAYARTKRAEVVLAEVWADEWAAKGVTVNSTHPGWVDTAGVRDALPTFRRFTSPFLRNEAQGADSIVWMVASDDAADLSGKFVHDREPRKTHRTDKTRQADAKRGEFLQQIASDAAPYLE
ncbi:MAG: SDR family NAD(P)-dependent oxidoreductase [Acidimicrobiia bacterium]